MYGRINHDLGINNADLVAASAGSSTTDSRSERNTMAPRGRMNVGSASKTVRFVCGDCCRARRQAFQVFNPNAKGR
jgi:hypothetical protein